MLEGNVRLLAYFGLFFSLFLFSFIMFSRFPAKTNVVFDGIIFGLIKLLVLFSTYNI